MFGDMENLDTDRVEPPKKDYPEKCFSCGRELKEGQGRFRKPKGVFCIGCYSDNDTESNSGTSLPSENAS